MPDPDTRNSCDRANDCPLNCSELKDNSYCFPVNISVECINWWDCKLTAGDFSLIETLVAKGISKEQREVIEAVIGGEYNCEHCEHFALDNNPFGDPCFDEWICKRDYELKNEHWVCGDWTRRKPTPVTKPLPTFEDMKGIYADKPCPTCGGSGSVPCRPDEHGGVNDLRECPTCTGKHFVPGKGRGM